MDYNKVKLGLIGRFKVWRARREAEKDREWNDKIEHEVSEVDYSEAERLEAEVRRNLGLDNYEPPINEEEVKKRRELEKALEEAEREAEQSGARVRK